MVAFNLCNYIPPDIDVETLMDLESSVLSCAGTEDVLSVEAVMDRWYQLIISRSNEFERFVEFEHFISEYIGGLSSDMRSVIISQLETFGVTVVDWETGTVLNSPQVSLTGDVVSIDGDRLEYTLPPGGEFIEHYDGKQHLLINHRDLW